MTLKSSWVTSANSADHPFPLNNLPYGIFSTGDSDPRCGVAIGDMILDLRAVETAGLLKVSSDPVFGQSSWNGFMALGRDVWSQLRATLTDILAQGSEVQDQLEPHLVAIDDAQLHMPIKVAEYTDFYAGRHHAVNVGSMFRDPANALPPNWLHIPIGYNGRASSVVVSGSEVRRPWGQLKGPTDDLPRFAPSARFDIELEMGAIVGTASKGPITVQEAYENIFGYVLLNDWSARDIQAWEYQPLGPFQAKSTATTISPWIVTAAALEPFRSDTPTREFELLDHIKDCGPMLYDIALDVTLTPSNGQTSTIAQTNYAQMYYSAAQQLAHHTSAGSPMNVGDLLGSGTISGPQKHQRGSLLELSWGGKEPFTLDSGETRSFIEDGDTLALSGNAKGDGFTVGFGPCTGTLLPALESPYAR
ncbi:MAG: fumarylacetoacetase [Pseudoruegeria sp.]